MDEHTCGFCGERFTEIITFLLHKVTHVDGSRSSSCLLCGLSFSRQISLREHLHRKHNIPGARPNAGKETVNGKRRGRPPKKDQHLLPEKDDLHSTPSREILTEEASDGCENVHVTNRGSDGSNCGFPDSGENVNILMTAGNRDNAEVYQQGGDISASAPETMHVVIEGIKDVITNTFPQSTVQAYSVSDTGHQGASEIGESAVVDPASNVSQMGDHVTTSHLHEPGVSRQFENSEGETVFDASTIESETGATLIPQNNGAIASTSDNDSSHNISQAVVELEVNSDQSSMHITSGDRSELDFLFILLSKSVKGNAFNYSKISFKCFHCEYHTTWRNCLVRHMREKHPNMLAIHQCISIQNPETADQQQVMKMSEYTSLHAHQRKLTKNKRIRTVESQDLPGTFPCKLCKKTFGRLRYLRQHMHTHRADKKHLCDECGKAFKAKSYLAVHRQTHKEKSYSCSQCDFTSSISSLIHAHRQLHSEGCVLCDICGSAYGDRTTLKKHKVVHDPSRPYPCTYQGCTWRFSNEVMCRAHFRAHTTPGRFVCSVCGYVFRHKHHLQRHLTKIHGMDKATVNRMTAARNQNQTQDQASAESGEGTELPVLKPDDAQPIQETVNLIMDSDISSEQLQTMLEIGQLVIATDGSDNTINYEVADITMGVDCHTLIENEEAAGSGQTILIPHPAECSQIILQQEPETVPADVET
ncbi:hypothetical protein BaRGS_00011131 [Batillaria attramentaria]|uniref:C2H2-type domain-containing protein n=1 Tax=Batillaria attramentaria TaxID=370345 RepID=A0ABD0LEI1_9CAEN